MWRYIIGIYVLSELLNNDQTQNVGAAHGFKKAEDVFNEIQRMTNIPIQFKDNKIYKRFGRHYVFASETLGDFGSLKTRIIEKLPFVESVERSGVNGGVIFLNT